MRPIYTLLLSLCFFGAAQAQVNDLAVFTSQSNLHTARWMPSAFGTEESNFQFSLPYLHLNVGTNMLTRAQGTEILNGGKISSALIEEILADMPQTLQTFASVNVSPVSMGGSIRVAGKEIVSIYGTVTEQIGAKVSLNKEIPAFAWYGNKRFAGINLPLGPVIGEALWQREYAFGAAAPIPIPLPGYKFRVGAKAKYITGIAALQTDYSRFDFLTAGDGSSITADVEATYNTAGFKDIDPLGGAGKGFGLDFGVSMEMDLLPITIDLSVIDLGSKIKWTEATRRYDINGSETFEGIQVENLFTGDSVTFEQFDSLDAYIDLIETDGWAFETVGNTRIFVRAGYTLAEGYNEKLGDYPVHSIYATYMQGLKEGALSSTKPQVSLAYVYNLLNILEAGAKFGYAWNSFQVGAFAGVKAGPFRWGIGSGDLGALFIGSSNYGADLTTNFSFVF